jgi:hypothetical protein
MLPTLSRPWHLRETADAEKGGNSMERQWFLRWYNAPVHTAAVMRQYLQSKTTRCFLARLFSLDLAPAGFILLPKVKDHLAGFTLTQDTFKSICEWTIWTLSTEVFTAANRLLLE